MGSRLGAGAAVVAVALSCSTPPQPERAKPSPDAETADGGGAEDDSGSPPPDGGIVFDGRTALPEPGPPCNGNPAYCERRYGELCQLATHDSAANSLFWTFPTQSQSLQDQLNGGVRALILHVESYQGVVSVCRVDCTQGNIPLGVVLGTVKQFFLDNGREVVTLLIDTPLPAATIAAEVMAVGLDTMALARDPSAPWPTLGQMIDVNQRLVVLVDAPDSGPAWLLPRHDLLWETRADWASLAEMNCNPAIGDPSAPLSLVHHDLRGPSDGGDATGAVDPALAREANDFAVASARLQGCKAQYARAPSFMAVDFSSEGDANGATQVVNGVRAPP